MSELEALCVGDTISLYSEEVNGFIIGFQSSSVNNELAVFPRQHRDKPAVPDCQAISFIVHVANRYKLSKSYKKLKLKSESASDDLALKARVTLAETAAISEEEDNISEQKRQLGKKLVYGQIIQLLHSFTEKYAHVSTTQTSLTESSNIQVALQSRNGKHAMFKIMPRYKVKAEGDLVQMEDQIILESIKSPGQFLHVSKTLFGKNSVYGICHEVNLSVRPSGFSVYRRYKPEKIDENSLRAGVPMRLFHKEIEGNLCAEGLFDDEVTEEVHFRVRQIDESKARHLTPSTSAITYWQLEFESGSVNGSVVRWEQQCRFKHMTTRQYMTLAGGDTKKILLTYEQNDPHTVFRLHPVIKEDDRIAFQTYCRIEHVVTGYWLHAEQDEYVRKNAISSSQGDMSMSALQWTRAPLKKLGVTKEMQYDDAFTIQRVRPKYVTIFNYVAGMVPFIEKIVKDALKELKEFMIVNSVPSKKRQKLLRNLRVVELLVRLLQIPIRGSPDQHHLTGILVEAYDVLYTYLMGDSRKNELYIAKHIDFFNSQISFQGAIGLNAAKMVMELIKDNRKIVDRITHTHINGFVELLKQNKNHRYLDLLAVLCVCDGMSIPDNQKYITETWLMKDDKNCVYHTDLGQKIGKEHDIIYVSIDNCRHWTKLEHFVKVKCMQTDEKYLFLENQLYLFGKLCFGRNAFAIEVITERLCYLSIDEAFLCLTNNNLPDELRTVYCSLITDMAVDVGDSISVLGNINLTFVYDEIGASDSTINTFKTHSNSPSGESKSGLLDHISQIRSWISSFLADNKDMTASLRGHNSLVEQVLRLVCCLVKFGHYGNMNDMKQLLNPFLSLLDGRNDKMYPSKHGVAVIQSVRNHYRLETRFKQSPETKAIVDAKYRAMQVLDLFFNFQFNTRLESFVREFKNTYQKSQQTILSIFSPELSPLLSENYDFEQDCSTNRTALKKLTDIFSESDYFGNYPLTDILLDLSHYEYDNIIVWSMALLNRCYSSHDNLFKRAVQAQILITDRSVEVLYELRKLLPDMQRLTSSKMSDEQTSMMMIYLDKLIGFCSLENEPEETHSMNQSILYNHEILSIVFDILSQEIDIKLRSQYEGVLKIFAKCFHLLRVMARENPIVQQRLFDRLDLLLMVQGAESELALALTEVFTGNKLTCMKIMPLQVKAIMKLVMRHTKDAHEFLDLLNAVVKVEEINLPLKRNQVYVMKYFMQFRAEVAYVIDQPKDARLALLKGPSCKDLDYLISLIDLLATCAEGENRFIESICQTIFSIEELMDILNDTKVSNDLKRTYLRFLHWVYLNTASGMIESGAGDQPHNPTMWKYLNGLCKDFEFLTKYAEDHPETVKHLLKIQPGKSVDIFDDLLNKPNELNNVMGEEKHGDIKSAHSGLHYCFSGVMPFLQIFYRSMYQPRQEDFPNEAEDTDKLAQTLVGFMNVIGPLITDSQQIKALVSSMSVVMSISTLPVEVMNAFQEKYCNEDHRQDIRSSSRKKYDEYYENEEELNNQLNTFAINFSVIYGGANTIRTQTGYAKDDDYTNIGGDDELPLGHEFQVHLSCFIKRNQQHELQFSLAGKLVKQLEISASNTSLSEVERMDHEVLDIKCLQLLRGLIYNEICKLPDDWELDTRANERQLERIKNVQNSLNEFEAVLKVLPHLSTSSDKMIREVLAFLIAMLYGGNQDVQKNFIDYFLGTREEKFFFSIKNRMLLSTVATKEKRSLHAQFQAKVEEAIEEAKALRKAMQAGRTAEQQIRTKLPMGSTLGLPGMNMGKLGSQMMNKKKNLKSRYGSMGLRASKRSLNKSQAFDLQSMLSTPRIDVMNAKSHISKNKIAPVKHNTLECMDDKTLVAMIESQMQDDQIDYHDDGYIALVLKMMGLMCDNQNVILQDYLREQLDNIKSVNLISETSKFLSLIYSAINPHTIDLTVELFNTLVEFCSGNYNNQLVVFDSKVVDYMNYILRVDNFHGCTEKQVIILKKSITKLIVAMIEEVVDNDQPGAKEVADTLDDDIIWQTALQCYEDSQCLTKEEKKKKQEIYLHDLIELGYQFYHIILRINYLLEYENNINNKFVRSMKDKQAWAFYAKGTKSIEILKDGMLQKIHFRCKNKFIVREDIKEKFKYDVDRSSPSNKLRELMEWSKDIIRDIHYTRRVLSNFMFRFFVYNWWNFNMAMIFVSFLFVILIMVTWKQPEDVNSYHPDFTHTNLVNLLNLVFGIIHNILAFCVLISFFILNHPKLPRFTIFTTIRDYFKKDKEEYCEEIYGLETHRVSKLEVSFFSYITMWYLMIVSFSILGTLYYGYCFSFHLLHIAQFNQILRRTIRAVTQNGTSLIWVLVYGLIVIYIYSLLGFAFYRELFDGPGGLYCTTMYECSLTILHRGFIKGIMEFLEVTDNKPFSYHFHKAIFDLSFFIIITTIGLNIIFGIIVDTFSELRDNKLQIENDMTRNCFICSRNSYDFEHQGGGFRRHVKEEHNQWAYVLFFIHLDETRDNDYTALEFYISNLLSGQNYDFFPLNRALSLQQEKDENEVKFETLMDQVSYLVDKMKKEESEKEKDLERLRQIAWAKEHKGQSTKPSKS